MPVSLPARSSLALLTLLVLVPAVGLRAAAAVDVGDASVRESAGGHAWTIGNTAIGASIVVTKIGIQIESIARAGGANVVVPRFGDVGVTIDGVAAIPGDRTYKYESASAENLAGRAVLTLRFVRRDRPLVVERSFAVAPGAAVIETWTTVTADRALSVADPAAFSLEFTPRDAAWQRGLETPDSEGGPFTVRTRRLDDGAAETFGSDTLSSRQYLPWFTLAGNGERVTAALAWSGTWQASLHGTATGSLVDLGLARAVVGVAAGQRFEGPHGLVAVTADAPGEEARAMAAWFAARRNGRAYPAYVTYNSWFQFGIEIDDALMRREMDLVAALGGELFELDAGWYPPLNATDRFDFTAGLGSWQLDRSRFPNGLGVLSTYAHTRGLKFGVWVEPERVDLATVGRGQGAEDRFLARENGQYQAGVPNGQAHWGQICLATDEGWNWVRDRLFGFLDEARPDYLKIDLNGWATCTRDDHAHGAGGGNVGHVRGYYRLLEALRARYPALAIENVSGGARRLDPELLVRTDAAWVDDLTHPSPRVRHHQELLSTFVPPSALLSYTMEGAGEPLPGAVDLPRMARSRMLGVLGLAADLHLLRAQDDDDLIDAFGQYKTLRGLRGAGYASLLTPAVNIGGSSPAWDVVQQTNPASGIVTVYGFRNSGGARTFRIALRGLQATRNYRYWTFESGTLGVASGAQLMNVGLDLDASIVSAPIVILEPQ